MLKLQLNQTELAARLGVTPTAVSYYLNGRIPKSDVLFAMSSLFGCCVEDLFDEKNDPNSDWILKDEVKRAVYQMICYIDEKEFLWICHGILRHPKLSNEAKSYWVELLDGLFDRKKMALKLYGEQDKTDNADKKFIRYLEDEYLTPTSPKNNPTTESSPVPAVETKTPVIKIDRSSVKRKNR